MVREAERDLEGFDAGPEIRCPECGKVLMEAVAETIKTRCKHCKKWVYMIKKEIASSLRSSQ